jgi:hypothetical protein
MARAAAEGQALPMKVEKLSVTPSSPLGHSLRSAV